MDIAELGLRVNAQGVAQATRDMNELASSTGKAEGAAGKLKTTLGGLSGLAAATGLGLIGAKILKETIDAQNAYAQLEAAVRSTGGAAGYTAAALAEQASELQRVTTYSDEAVESAQALLLTFDKIKGDTFRDATHAVADLAARMGGDLQGAALQVGKALQDPEQGLVALRRSGVSFSDAQTKVIKDLYAGGEAAKAQSMILKELEHEFGGSAAAARNTLGGALVALKNQFSDLLEVSNGTSAGLVTSINSIGDALPKAGAALSGVLQDFQLDIVDTSVEWEHFKNLLSGGSNESVDNWAKQRRLEIMGLAADLAKASHDTATVQKQSADQRAADDQKATKEIALQVERQKALNAVFGQSPVIIAEVTAKFDMLADVMKYGETHTASATAKFKEYRQELAGAAVDAVRLTEGEDLKRNELAQTTKVVDDLMKSLDQLREQYEKTNAANTKFADSVSDALNAARGTIKPETTKDPFADALAANAKYVAEMRREWMRGIDAITAHGLGSFRSFFEETLQMFTRMISRMEKAGKDSGLGYQLLGVGSAAIGGGLAGYQVGQSSGSAVTGALGGAASGAIAGAAYGPWGAAIGGLAGLTGGLLGAASAANKLTHDLAQTFVALQKTASDFAHPENDNDPYKAVHDQAQAMRDAALDTFTKLAQDSKNADEAYKAYKRTLVDVNAGEKARIALLEAERIAANDANNARIDQMGRDAAAATAAVRAQENNDAFAKFSDANQSAFNMALQQAGLAADAVRDLLQQQVQATQDALSIAKDQLSALQKAADTDQKVVDTLTTFSQSLKVGTYSPLSSAQQLAEARRQFQTQTASAMTGNVDAASSLPQFAQTFLDASRAYNASGSQYVADFRAVQAAITAVNDQFGAQLTVDQMALNEAQMQTDLLGNVLATLQAQLDFAQHPEKRNGPGTAAYWNGNAHLSNPGDAGPGGTRIDIQGPWEDMDGNFVAPGTPGAFQPGLSGGTTTPTTAPSNAALSTIARNTTALVNGGAVSTQALVDELQDLGDKIAALAAQISRQNDAAIQLARATR